MKNVEKWGGGDTKKISILVGMEVINYPIKNWAPDDRPREKLVVKGPENLSDSELLAILVRSGTKELMKVKGIGEAKAITIAACLELGRRRQVNPFLDKKIISASGDIAEYFQAILKDHSREVFAVIFLNRANKATHFEVISEGGITGTVADPRVILKKALDENAVNIILCHNHPSGSLKPSRADEQLTKKIKEAARLFDIKVLDHIIVSECGYYSFADDGLL